MPGSCLQGWAVRALGVENHRLREVGSHCGSQQPWGSSSAGPVLFFFFLKCSVFDLSFKRGAEKSSGCRS